MASLVTYLHFVEGPSDDLLSTMDRRQRNMVVTDDSVTEAGNNKKDDGFVHQRQPSQEPVSDPHRKKPFSPGKRDEDYKFELLSHGTLQKSKGCIRNYSSSKADVPK